MVSRMLSLCGVYLGEDNIVRNADHTNEKGSWEHGALNEINDQLLFHLGGTYKLPPIVAPNWENDPSLQPLYEEARSEIQRSFNGRELWGWKMPRACYTIPFWRRVIPGLQFVICLRNPLDFSASLNSYEGFASSYSLIIWERANIAALTNTSPEERIITQYEEYFPDFRAGLYPLLDFLRIPRPELGSAVDRQIEDFHEPGLKHHSSSIEELLATPDVSIRVKLLYSEMARGRRDGSKIPYLAQAVKALPEIQRDLVNASAQINFDHLIRLEQKHASLLRDYANASNENRHLKQILASRTHKLADKVCSVLINARKALRAK